MLKTEDEWIDELRKIIEVHGKDVVESWCDESNKHKHKVIHILVSRNYAKAVRVAAELEFNLNVQRESDLCTPLHLAMFYRKKHVIETLVALGVDQTLKNRYGEACDEKYQNFVTSYQNIIWLDLELTAGHYDAEDGRILEVAVIVTDKDLNELDRGQWVIGGFSEEELNALKDFHQQHFRDAEDGGRFPPRPGCPGNGLFSAIVTSTVTLPQAQQELLLLLKKHCPEQSCPLGGNSIQCDREVLKTEMPDVYKYVSHQIIDVSSFAGIASRWLPNMLEQWREDSRQNANYNHRAMNDVEASIQSMRWIRSNMLAQPV